MSAEPKEAGRYRALARLCRNDAKRAQSDDTRRLLLSMAADYESKAAAQKS